MIPIHKRNGLTEERIRRTLMDFEVSGNLHDGLVRYVLKGIPTGDFLASVLSNDLWRAIKRCNAYDAPKIVNIVDWLLIEAPAPCWGSLEAYQSWVKLGIDHMMDTEDE